MQHLKERIIQDGRCFPGGILKVDSFINHQMDPVLMKSIAEEFVQRFSHLNINKILTIEASGIAPAIMVGYLLKLPVVFIKKKQPKTMQDSFVSSVRSFTKGRDYTVCVSQEFLTPKDKVIFIDDFLAYGNAAFGAIDIVRQSGAELLAMGFIIEKSFQDGGEKLRQTGLLIESLVQVSSLEDCKIKFV